MLVELALLFPLIMLVLAGGLVLGLAMNERQNLTWAAQEASYAAAGAGAEDSACDAARATAGGVLGRSYAWPCDGSDGLTMDYDPAGSPALVTITLDGRTWSPPFIAAVTIHGRAAAVIRPLSP